MVRCDCVYIVCFGRYRANSLILVILIKSVFLFGFSECLIGFYVSTISFTKFLTFCTFSDSFPKLPPCLRSVAQCLPPFLTTSLESFLKNVCTCVDSNGFDGHHYLTSESPNVQSLDPYVITSLPHYFPFLTLSTIAQSQGLAVL